MRLHAPSVSALPLLLGLTGCTAIILSDAQGADAPCASLKDCGAAQLCTRHVCVADERDPSPPAAPGSVGDDGGTVPGPDGVILDIPAGALVDATHITITRGSSTTVLPGLVARSRFYRLAPDLDLRAAATLTLPVEGACPACVVFRQDSEGFVPLPAVLAAGEGVVSCTTDALGVFVAAEDAP